MGQPPFCTCRVCLKCMGFIKCCVLSLASQHVWDELCVFVNRSHYCMYVCVLFLFFFFCSGKRSSTSLINMIGFSCVSVCEWLLSFRLQLCLGPWGHEAHAELQCPHLGTAWPRCWDRQECHPGRSQERHPAWPGGGRVAGPFLTGQRPEWLKLNALIVARYCVALWLKLQNIPHLRLLSLVSMWFMDFYVSTNSLRLLSINFRL